MSGRIIIPGGTYPPFGRGPGHRNTGDAEFPIVDLTTDDSENASDLNGDSLTDVLNALGIGLGLVLPNYYEIPMDALCAGCSRRKS